MKELGRQRKNLKDDLRRLKYKTVLGSFPEGQGYADKRKRLTISRYLKHRRKSSKNKQSAGPDRQEVVDHAANQENTDYSGRDAEIGDQGNDSVMSEETYCHGRKQTSNISFTEAEKSPTKRWQDPQHRYSNAQKEYQEKQNKKQQRSQTMQEEKMKREQALKHYRKKKVDRNKKFNQKTKRGQPIMKHQINFLLEKIKAQGD